ncbi:MAG: DMT family transporter [Alphaproteobacteria bacterium]|nr:DMT family transporter [Alphaproteobacteria bacterium]
MRTKHSPALKAITLAFCGFSLWSFADAAVRHLHFAGVPSMQVAFIADIFSLSFLCLASPWLGGFRETFRRPKLKLRIFRGVLLTMTNLLAFYAFAHLPLAKAYAIIFLIPLMSKILSVFLMGEKITPASWAISAAGFAGVLIVLRPGWVPLELPALAALAITFIFALGYVLARYIGEENQTPLSMALFQYTFATIAAGSLAWDTFASHPPEPAALAAMAFIGICGGVGSMLVARGYATAPSASVAPVHYTQILWGVLFGALLFGEFPDLWTALGASVIIGAGLALIRASRAPVAIRAEGV